MVKRKNKKAFTLTEILAVIVILGVLLLIAVPTVSNLIENSRRKAFFLSVSNIVNSLKPEDVLNENEYCIYDYSKDEENQNNDIKSMYVLMHTEDSKNIYSVYASYKEGEIGIDVYDFSTLTVDNSSEWVNTPTTKEIESDEIVGEIDSATEFLVKMLQTGDSLPKHCYVKREGN